MRPPSVVVRDLLPEEGNQLKRLSRKASSELKRERALICWASATRMSPQQIAALVAGYPRQLRGNVAAPAGRTVTYMPRLRGAKWECGPRGRPYCPGMSVLSGGVTVALPPAWRARPSVPGGDERR